MIAVVILVSNADLEPLAKSIQTTLQTTFFTKTNTITDTNGTSSGGRNDTSSTTVSPTTGRTAVAAAADDSVTVSIRSALLVVPPERLLAEVESEAHEERRTVLFVSLEDSTTTTTTSYLDAHSEFPVLHLNSVVSAAAAISLQTKSDQQQHLADQCALTIAKYCSLASSTTTIASNIRRVLQSVQQQQQQAAALASDRYSHRIALCFDQGLQITGDAIAVSTAQRTRGKVRDRWEPTTNGAERVLALVTTDRQSGFDRQLAVVPYKGAVLNLCSQFWFEATHDIIPNHLIAVPHPSVSIVRSCQPFPIEFVVRSYLTGSTSTSIWKNYQAGVRLYCGHLLPEGMTKNQKLPETLLTPTTKEEEHDRLISLTDIVSEGWMTQADLDVCGAAALAVFARGQEIASTRGLILVDTKYEFGRCHETGCIRLIDEVHTPDSSRYWLANSYQERIAAGKEPENIDKEFLRLWFADHCDPYQDAVIPDAPRDLVLELARRYIQLYEMITGQSFDFDIATRGEADIAQAIKAYM